MIHVKLDNRGVSMAEMLVAMVVLLFVSMAMMQVALVSIESNTNNLLRDEGTRLAERTMNELRSLTASERDAILNGVAAGGSKVHFNGIINTTVRRKPVGFTVTSTLTDIEETGFDQVDVQVQWEWKGKTYNTALSTLME